MKTYERLSHSKWECKYHIVFIPKYRRKVIYGKLRSAIGRILRDLCKQKGVEVLEGHAMPDHVHMCLKIPPKYAVSFIIGFVKGKSAVRIHRELLKERRMTGLHFWATGYSVSTVGLDEEMIRKFVRSLLREATHVRYARMSDGSIGIIFAGEGEQPCVSVGRDWVPGTKFGDANTPIRSCWHFRGILHLQAMTLVSAFPTSRFCSKEHQYIRVRV